MCTVYFQCAGCKDCNAEVTNRHQLANNEKEFEDEVRYIERTMIQEVDTQFDELQFSLRYERSIQQLSTNMNDVLKERVQEALRTIKTEHLTKESTEENFNSLWTRVSKDILSKNISPVEKDPNIEATVQKSITTLLGADFYRYVRAVTDRKRPEEANFTMDQTKHMKAYFEALSDQDVHRLQNKTDGIIEETSKHYITRYKKGKKFNQKDVEVLFKDILEAINEIHDEKFGVTDDYKVDLVYFIEGKAVLGFTEMHKRFFKKNSPDGLLKKKDGTWRCSCKIL